jgi:hypothetical protein
MFKFINSKLIFLLFGFLCLSVLFYSLFDKKVYSIRFVDEDHHTVIGSMIDQDTKLYRDLSTNHQPLPFLFSRVVESFIQNKEIKMMVKYNRAFMFGYGLIWFGFIVYLTKGKGLALMLLFEYVKYQYFGNLVLAESLAAYPLMYLFLMIMDVVWDERGVLKLNEYVQALTIAVSLFILIFNLAWLWPFIFVFCIFLFIKKRKLFFLSFIYLFIFTLLFFVFVIDFRAWLTESVINILKYTLPSFNLTDDKPNKLILLLLPFRAIWEFDSLLGLLVLTLLLNVIYICLNKKNDWKKFLLVYIFIFLTNNRVFNLKDINYAGFHLLPWVSAFLVLFVFTFDYYKKLFIKNNFAKICFLIATISIAIRHNPADMWNCDKEYDYYVKFSETDDINWFLKQISEKDEKMFVTDIVPLLFYGTGISPVGRQVDYYPWQKLVAEQQTDIIKDIDSDLITYIHTTVEADSIPGFKKYKDQNFIQVYKNKSLTNIWIHKSKLEKIDENLWESLNYRGFNLNGEI